MTGSEVVVLATADKGREFDGWSGDASGTDNPLVITMDSDKAITANFTGLSTKVENVFKAPVFPVSLSMKFNNALN